MKGESKEQALRNNLRDAGCGARTVERFLALEEAGAREEQFLLLSSRRRRILERIHRAERQIDCLDYLVYQLEKRRAGEYWSPQTLEELL